MLKTMRVVLLDVTNDALAIIYSACRQCYSKEFAGDIFAKSADNAKKQEDFVRKVVSSGHESPMEHVKFTFAVENVSRALTHQLVRHRMASYSQQSQRYVKADGFDYIIPPMIAKDNVTTEIFNTAMAQIQEAYSKILNILKEKGVEGEAANQDARFVLPQAAETKIVITMNCRELKHFFSERCCVRAQWEIRALAGEMLKICKDKLPSVFDGFGAKCVGFGYCPEGEKFTCKKYPLKEKALSINNDQISKVKN